MYVHQMNGVNCRRDNSTVNIDLVVIVITTVVCEGCYGATNVSPGTSDVHPVWHRSIVNPHHVHEEPGRLTQGQEEQKAGFHLSSEKRGRCHA